MSYQVIARKWRPRTFDELVGQSHISQTLINALRNERLPHALLFTGPRGTGKTSTARILAKALRCPNATDFSPCNVCEECQDIASGRAVNVIEIDGASNNGVDAIRELRDSVGYMPSSGRHKIYIIDEVHMLSTNAFNALLKTLEEPPPHVIFVMATTEVHKIPNTILSRCQRFDFRRISLRSICERMALICKDENVEAEPEALWAIARQGDGSMRDSQSLLDQVITFSQGKLTLQKVVDVLGLTDRQLINAAIEGLVRRDVKAMIDVVERLFQGGYDPKIYAQDLLEEIRHLLMIKIAPDSAARLVDLPEAEIDHLKRISAALSEEDIHLLFDMALKGANDIPRAQDPRVVLEMLLLRMAHAPRVESLLNLAARPQTPVASGPPPVARDGAQTLNRAPVPSSPARPAEARAVAAPMAPSKVAAPEPAAAPEKSLTGPTGETTQDQWADLVDRIRRINGVFAAKLEHTYLVGIKNKKVIVGVPAKMKFLVEKLNEGDALKKLATYMTTFWGPGYSIEIQAGAQDASAGGEALTPKEIESKKKADHQAEIRRQIENHPLVKSARDVFNTEIQSIKETT